MQSDNHSADNSLSSQDKKEKLNPDTSDIVTDMEAHEESTVDKNQIELLEKELEQAKIKIAQLEDKSLRFLAELDNFRKRTNKERLEWRDFYHQEIFGDILPVLDNFDRALMSALESDEAKKFAEGMILIDKQLHDILTKYGLMEIDCVGKPFDPYYHEALITFDTNEYPENTVIEEIQKGYMKNDKVIRPSMVKVSKYTNEAEI